MKKNNRIWYARKWEGCYIVRRVIREGLNEKVTFYQRQQGDMRE